MRRLQSDDVLTEHDWEDVGPVMSDAEPDRRWQCRRCGMRVRSHHRPMYDLQDVLYVTGPEGPFRPGPERGYSSDCDIEVVKTVMRS